MDKFSVLLFSGLTNGSVYGLVGLSLSLIYGANRVINFCLLYTYPSPRD